MILKNADFEDGFRNHEGIGELTVANFWFPWYSEAEKRHRPEYKPEKRGVGWERILTGNFAQKQCTTYAAQDGGIYQQIPVLPGKWYTFTAHCWNWSSEHNEPDRSAGKTGKGSSLVGINPWGDIRALYRTTIWGMEALEQYDQWVKVSVTARAWSDKIVVFLRGVAVWPVHHNDFYWDGLKLIEGGGPGPSPTPPPDGDVLSVVGNAFEAALSVLRAGS